MKNKIFTVLFLSTSLFSYNDLGTFGKTYAISERDALNTIKEHMKDINKTKMLNDMKSSIKKYMQVDLNIATCIETKKSIFDPTIKLDHNINMPKYNISIKKGMTFNPLDYGSLTKYLIFIDATNKQQLELVKMYAKESLIIVVKGDLQEVQKITNTQAYKGNKNLLKAFKVTCVPVIYIQRKKKYIKLEYYLEDNKND